MKTNSAYMCMHSPLKGPTNWVILVLKLLTFIKLLECFWIGWMQWIIDVINKNVIFKHINIVQFRDDVHVVFMSKPQEATGDGEQAAGSRSLCRSSQTKNMAENQIMALSRDGIDWLKLRIWKYDRMPEHLDALYCILPVAWFWCFSLL